MLRDFSAGTRRTAGADPRETRGVTTAAGGVDQGARGVITLHGRAGTTYTQGT